MSTTNLRRTLFVLWYDSKDRAILPVARLDLEAEQPYRFRYVIGAIDAQERGFLPFLAFPELGATYESRELFPFFANRVMPTTRPDYLEYLASLGLEPQNADPVAVLSRNGGRRETDRIEIVPLPEHTPSGAYLTHCLARGVHYFPHAEERIARLEPGEPLRWMLDAQNEYNPNAFALRTDDLYLVGYLPDYLVMDLAEFVERRVPMRVAVERVNLPPAPRHHRLLCSIEATWPDGFVPMSGEKYQPLPDSASS